MLNKPNFIQYIFVGETHFKKKGKQKAGKLHEPPLGGAGGRAHNPPCKWTRATFQIQNTKIIAKHFAFPPAVASAGKPVPRDWSYLSLLTDSTSLEAADFSLGIVLP